MASPNGIHHGDGETKKDTSFSKEWLRRQIPPVGTVLPRRLYDGKEYAHKPLPCEVISINYEKLHYRVKFGCGLTETFKVPEVRGY